MLTCAPTSTVWGDLFNRHVRGFVGLGNATVSRSDAMADEHLQVSIDFFLEIPFGLSLTEQVAPETG